MKLIREVETDLITNTSEIFDFTYSNNILIKREETEGNNVDKTEYIYENGKLIRNNYFNNSILTGNSTYTYTGDIISSMLSFEDNMYFLHNYTYNSDKKLISAQQFSNNILDSSKEFQYNPQGNMSRILSTNYNVTIEYDNYKNPYSLIFSEPFMNSMDGAGYSKNNVTRITESAGYITTYEYTYNDKGYPIQVIEKLNGVSKTRTTYTYE
ncbi:MAG TPA: hypothetical protein VF677_11880 [Flavobacterium sp.]